MRGSAPDFGRDPIGSLAIAFREERPQHLVEREAARPQDGDDERQRTSRLILCDLSARVLSVGLALLGIEAPERM